MKNKNIIKLLILVIILLIISFTAFYITKKEASKSRLINQELKYLSLMKLTLINTN